MPISHVIHRDWLCGRQTRKKFTDEPHRSSASLLYDFRLFFSGFLSALSCSNEIEEKGKRTWEYFSGVETEIDFFLVVVTYYYYRRHRITMEASLFQ